ncbi:mechanosensitive ion channel family protein [Shewanella eurypsychrophilus]|uniref:Small-conductance mechanosensitive channel n=1 Tax=Shewanella eurypsychrophilus TaxID=2593656 RepID=A0ABX6VAU4_9GAMM|nr:MULTISPECIES: mechanosensitive ion channel family protein [Shewanella]QFU24601.1 mechanosensitive ion channel [Shewanella sp. YLB-09]QPG59798.1 mechanosensitive ion channel family protein [Shewanella eurypsychrophilus]
MYRTLIIMMLAICSVSVTQAYAEDSKLALELSALQQSIDRDVSQLRLDQGELSQFTEYRIKQKADKLHQKLKEQMGVTPLDIELLTPYVTEQIKFLQAVDAHYAASITNLKSQLGKGNDAEIMMLFANREMERDDLLQAKLDVLTWAEQLSINTGDMKAQFTANLLQRADTLDSLVHYTQDKLKVAVADASLAGKDVSSEQTVKVTQLNERLSHSSSSLGVAVELLDTLGQDTSELKQTLFSTSGDITQDVLNLDVASSLIEQWFTSAKTQAMENGPSVVFKLFIFSLILLLSSLVGKGVEKLVKKAVSNSKLKFSKLLQDFFISLSGKAVFTIGLLIALSQLGFELGPLLAGFGVAGVIIGFALQDTLSNFASGMMILIYRPYDVGDLINAAGVTGKVSHMSLVSTTIKTLDNQRLIIPNNKIWGDTINNITVEHQRRVDMTFGIGYSDDIEKAERVLKEIIQAHPKTLQEPEAMVKLHTLGESSVDFIVRPWARPEDYWDVYWDITREVKMRFDQENISIPFPQRDVHIYQN